LALFITIEGPEGGGKTSHIQPLAKWLKSLGFNICVAREPGGTSIGDQIRAIVVNLKNKEIHSRTEILLFQASRAQLVEQVIKPHLDAGEIVICDRYAHSTLAYQGYGQGTDLKELRRLIHFATDGVTPDLTILLDIDVEDGLKRKTQNSEWNRMDAKTVEFHQRVRAGYLEMVENEPQRWVVVDAGGAWNDVQKELRVLVNAKLGNMK